MDLNHLKCVKILQKAHRDRIKLNLGFKRNNRLYIYTTISVTYDRIFYPWLKNYIYLITLNNKITKMV